MLRSDSAAICSDRGPPLASLMKHRKVGIGYLDAEVRQQVAAVSQGEIQVTIANFAQLS